MLGVRTGLPVEHCMPVVAGEMDLWRRACGRCSLQRLCLPYGLDGSDIMRLEQLVSIDNPVACGHVVFEQGDYLSALYAVRSGAMKSVIIDEDGLEQVLGFHYPGDLLGLDGMADRQHHCSALALEHSTVCRIPFERLDALLDELPSLRRQLMRLMSQALLDDEELLMSLGRKSSEGRIASLLLSLSHRRELRGLAATPVRLAMKRADLASFLRMRTETISRVLKRLQVDGIIRLDKRDVDIVDPGQLRAWAGRSAWLADQ